MGALDEYINRMLPGDHRCFTFMVSLTTLPCAEDVLWIVMRQPMQPKARSVIKASN